ncbi:hypothetical protein CDD81_2026 [Ophiocordyceps australis]|uniref:ABC transporter n=1 Tax=Ophiocordyceps australis TaxID=1399860 RepID=A0A2C5YFE4_9HYPO|nr:hypothetical protein CDD81_2026 [Ophiocordyceps australis]
MSCADDSFGPWAGPSCRGGFDFTLLFEESILAIPLDAIFLVAALARQRIRQDTKTEKSTENRIRSICKLGTASCLIILRLTLIVLWAASATSRTRASVPAAALSLASAMAYLLLSWREHERSVRPSFEIEMYLFFSILFNLARTRTLWLLLDQTAIPAIMTAAMALQAMGIVFESWEKRRVLRKPFSNWAAESLSGTFNRSLFFWLNPILLLGSRKILTLSDLPRLDVKLEADKLQADFNEAWEKVPDKAQSGALLSTWLSAHSRMILAGALPKLCLIAFLFTQPLLVERAMSFASTPDQPVFNNVGYGLIGAYALVYTGIAVSTGQEKWRMVRATTYMRGAIVPCITRKTLRIDLAQARSASALTLITTDIETIDGGIMVMHDLWGTFIEIALGAYLLWRQIGSAMGIPLGVVFFVVIVGIFMAVPVGIKLAEWIKASEVRVAATSRTLGNVKSYRMAGLNSIVFAAIEQLRVRELEISRTFRLWFGAATILPLCLPALNPVLSFAGFVGLSSGSGGLSVSQALTSLSILALLNRPLTNLSVALPAVAGAIASFDRIQEYLNVEEKEDKRIHPNTPCITDKASSTPESLAHSSNEAKGNESCEKVVPQEQCLPDGVMATINATLTWPGSEKPVLCVRDLRIPSSAVTVLLGPTGCGKTTLLNTLLGELTSFQGTICIATHEIAYCAQNPWLPNGTIREVIAGKMDYDEAWYSRTIRNKGIMLSGGQRQRIAIARALYTRKKLYIFDDAFKGLDSATSEVVMKNLLGLHGLLRSSGMTSIISSSDNRCVRHADYLVTMSQDGQVVSQGRPEESNVSKELECTEIMQDEKDQVLSKEDQNCSPNQVSPKDSRDDEQREAYDYINKELDGTRQTGDASVHMYYARAAGLRPALAFVAALIVGAFTDAFSQIWLLWWTEAVALDPNTPTGKWLGVYAALGVLGIICNLIAAWQIFIVVITKTGIYFHSMLVKTVSQAPMSFFSTVDQGVTVNRFSQDMQLIDMELPASALGAAVTLATVIGQCVLIGVTGRYIAATFPFIMLVFYLIQKFYLRTSRQMRLLDIEHKAPLYSQTIETLDGLASIRAFGFQGTIMTTMCSNLDDSQRPVYLLACLQQWLLFASDMTVAVLAVILITITATLREQIGVGFMGLALSNVVAFSSTLQMLLVTWVQLEITIGAVARVKKFTCSIEPEKLEKPSAGPPGPEWPSEGNVSFCNMSASYPGTGRILHDIKLEIPAGSKIGICGRTGSGKSSLALALFKMVQIDQGSIVIDNIDIATVAHDTLRDSIVGVPQDFFTLDGTLRFNIDPRATKSDEEIIQILENARLWTTVESRGGLDLVVSEDTLSFGELQLLAFARAMARSSKVLVLDEVSSSMDDTNSAVVDELIRTWFKDWTIITVAHKLESIRQFDKIVVLDAGQVVEYDSPQVLLADPSSFFKKLYEKYSARW